VIAGILCRFQDIAMDRYKFKASLCLILHLHPAETPVNVFHHLILPKTQIPAVPHGKNRSCKNFAVWPVSLTISDTNTHEVNRPLCAEMTAQSHRKLSLILSIESYRYEFLVVMYSNSNSNFTSIFNCFRDIAVASVQNRYITTHRENS